MSDVERDDAVRALLDALSMPSGRDVRKAWERATLLFGRFGSEMRMDAFDQYIAEKSEVRR